MNYRQFEAQSDILSDAQRKGWEYWKSLRGAGSEAPPPMCAFHLIDLPARILPTTHLVDVLEGGEEFRFRFWGSGMTAFLGYDATGKLTRDLCPVAMGARLHEVFGSMVRTRQAMCMVSEFERPASKVTGFQKFIRMPLLAADGSVGQILSLVEFLVDKHEALALMQELAPQSLGYREQVAGN